MMRPLLYGVEVGSLCMAAMFLGAMTARGETWLAVWDGAATLIIAWLILWELRAGRR